MSLLYDGGMIEKETLVNLYVHQGKSMQEIATSLNRSLHAVAYWMNKYGIKSRSRSDALYVKNNPGGDPFLIKEIENREDAKLLGLGLGLYWGEGNKKNKGSVRLGNTNPLLIGSFIEFLIEILGISKSKLRFGLQIFSDIQQDKALDFWLENLKKFNVDRSQFFKITVTPSGGIGNYREKSEYGVLTVYYCNSKLKKLLDSMLPL
jgi:hypothetical protein